MWCFSTPTKVCQNSVGIPTEIRGDAAEESFEEHTISWIKLEKCFMQNCLHPVCPIFGYCANYASCFFLTSQTIFLLVEFQRNYTVTLLGNHSSEDWIE